MIIMPRVDCEAGIKLRWREGEKAPCEMERYSDALAVGSVVCCKEVVSKLGEIKSMPRSTVSPPLSRC